MQTTYILRALSETGEESFYTGTLAGAGAGWIVADSRQALTFETIEKARHIAALLNDQAELTGQRFIAIANTSRYS